MPNMYHWPLSIPPGLQQLEHLPLSQGIVAPAQLRMLDTLLHIDDQQYRVGVNIHFGLTP
jgi:hypothetical protein